MNPAKENHFWRSAFSLWSLHVSLLPVCSKRHDQADQINVAESIIAFKGTNRRVRCLDNRWINS